MAVGPEPAACVSPRGEREWWWWGVMVVVVVGRGRKVKMAGVRRRRGGTVAKLAK